MRELAVRRLRDVTLAFGIVDQKHFSSADDTGLAAFSGSEVIGFLRRSAPNSSGHTRSREMS